MLQVCSSYSGAALRDSIQAMAREGWTTEELVDWVLANHGEEYLAYPEASGTGLLAWLVPPTRHPPGDPRRHGHFAIHASERPAGGNCEHRVVRRGRGPAAGGPQGHGFGRRAGLLASTTLVVSGGRWPSDSRRPNFRHVRPHPWWHPRRHGNSFHARPGPLEPPTAVPAWWHRHLPSDCPSHGHEGGR